MKLGRNAKKFVFSFVYAKLIFVEIAYFIVIEFNSYCHALEDIQHFVHIGQDIDIVFSTRCEAKCWNKPDNEKISCIRNCLNGSWNKPGTCPSNTTVTEKDDFPNLAKPYANTSCLSDVDCSVMLKCCHNICDHSLGLENETGLESIPTGIEARINKNVSNADDVVVMVRWSSAATKSHKVFYLVEEYHRPNRDYLPHKLTQWRKCKHTGRTMVEFKNLLDDRWYWFRVMAVNENGTLGASVASEPVYTAIIPKAPKAPENLTVSATSWGGGQLHYLITWNQPYSEAPITKYLLTTSSVRNYTMTEHRHTLPSSKNNFWLHHLEAEVEYFIQVQAVAHFERKKLKSKTSSIFLRTPPTRTHASRHASQIPEKKTDLKYKRRIKNLTVESVYWLHETLFARIIWTSIKSYPTNYTVTWYDQNRSNDTEARYIAKTDLTNFEMYGLEPQRTYSVSVKARLHRSLYVAKTKFSTNHCQKNESALDNVIKNCTQELTTNPLEAEDDDSS